MIRKDSSYNLFSLYKETVQADHGICIHDFGKFKVLENRTSAWPPNIAYDINTDYLDERLINSIEYEMNNLGLHPFVIGELKNDDLEVFEKHGFKPIEQWLEMQLIGLELPKKIRQPDEVETFLIDEGEFDEWTAIVSRVLFKGKTLDSKIFRHLETKGAKIAGMKVNGKWAGTSVTYLDDQGGAGIYMVCIDEEYRGKGFGKWLVNISLEEIKKSGINRCFLQSTKKGINLYKSMKFEKTGNYYLYWKIK